MAASSDPQVILCTGANRGFGFEIIHVLALRVPSSIFILACRKLSSGHEAVRELRKDGVTSDIEVVQLDVTKVDEIAAAGEFVKNKYGRLDVLINNAGIALFPDSTLSSIQEAYSTVLATNVTSVAVITNAFLPLLHASTGRPKVINITSGLASITRAKQWKMLRAPAYASSKIGLNGLTVYMQLAEDERAEKEAAANGGRAGKGSGNARVSFYCANPGLLKTALTNFMPMAKDPKDGAEVVVRLALEVGGPYEEAAIWEFEQGRMRQVPW